MTFGHWDGLFKLEEEMGRNIKMPPKRMPLAEPVAETQLARRMKAALGDDEFQVLRTFQKEFGAKMVHYQDDEGEVGKRPGWL